MKRITAEFVETLRKHKPLQLDLSAQGKRSLTVELTAIENLDLVSLRFCDFSRNHLVGISDVPQTGSLGLCFGVSALVNLSHLVLAHN
jgi:hypothetical protein